MILHLLRKYHPFFILIVLFIMIISFPTVSFADAEKIFKENSGAVVVIVAFDEKGNPISQGSGFVVRQDGAIVTNYHVISNAKDIAVKVGKKVLKVEGLLHLDKENDIAILKAKVEKLQKVKIGDIGKINVGEKVYVISSPQGLENTISEGILSGIREIDPERKILQITAPVSKGSSGGPVFNKDGEVIGVATFIIEEAQNLNFAIPTNLIKNKIAGKKIIALKDTEIEDYKKTAEYCFYLGVYYTHAGLYKEAIEAYKQAIKIKPDYANAHNNVGVVYGRDLGMYKEAIEACNQAISIKPDLAEAHLNLGNAYGKLGMYKEEIEAYKQAIRIKPDYAMAYCNLGKTYGKLGMYREAVAVFKQAIEITPDYVEAHHNLGVTYHYLGMYNEAIEEYKQTIIIKPDYANAHVNLGQVYLITGNKKLALEQYKILKSLDSELAERLFKLIYK